MLTIATLILLGLLAGIYFTVKKILNNRKVKKDKEIAQAEYLKQIIERDALLKAEYSRKKYSDSKKDIEIVADNIMSIEAINDLLGQATLDEDPIVFIDKSLEDTVMKAIAKRKKVPKSKYYKRFV